MCLNKPTTDYTQPSVYLSLWLPSLSIYPFVSPSLSPSPSLFLSNISIYLYNTRIEEAIESNKNDLLVYLPLFFLRFINFSLYSLLLFSPPLSFLSFPFPFFLPDSVTPKPPNPVPPWLFSTLYQFNERVKWTRNKRWRMSVRRYKGNCSWILLWPNNIDRLGN